MVQIIRNPCVPLTIPISGGMYSGRSIVIRGTPLHSAEQRFCVDLLTSKGTLPLHINPRFGFGGSWQIILNSSTGGGQWSSEVRHANCLQIGIPFELQICVEQDKYHLTINGNRLCDFHHRELVCNVNALRITGDVAIEYINFPDFAPYPTYGAYGGQPVFSMPMQQPPLNHYQGMRGPSLSYQDFNCPSVPFMTMIHGGYNPSRRITVVGTPISCVDTFSINLKSDNEFLFHFNPRFRSGPVVVRNSTRCGAWQAEERGASCFPFVPNQTFSMDICSSGSLYIVTVNGQHFTTFASRDDPCRINQLTIEGGITLQKVIIQ
uniref:Galectin n=1 Tax=Plectus sambesii TaxID=2011161 RepID=A0A914X173_9BILA